MNRFSSDHFCPKWPAWGGMTLEGPVPAQLTAALLAASLGLALKGDLKYHREMPTLCVEEKMKVDKVNWLLESLSGPQHRLKA